MAILTPRDWSPPVAQIYTVRNKLTLRLLDHDSPNRIDVTIDHTFLPFTKSQVFRVSLQPKNSGANAVSLPSTAVLKLYDRRYINDRKGEEWSQDVESSARHAWREKHFDDIEDPDSFYRWPRDPEANDDSEMEDYFRWLVQVR